MDRLLLIDGHSVAYRAFFALPVENFATSTGQSTNAVYGFTSMLINLLRDEAPTHVAVAFDVSRESFRTEQYAEYKATRSASPPEFDGQVELIREVLDALGIGHLHKDGFEADDIIATLSKQGRESGMEVLICSGDRDTFQLVRDTVTVLYPKRGVSDLARMTPGAVEEKFGLAPEQYPDLAALVGETSDNLPGVPGVGPKTAAKWIGAYGGLEGIMAALTDIPGKAGESLREHVDDVLRNRRLNALVTDLDLPHRPPDYAFSVELDRERIHRVFDALEFKTLRERLFEAFGQAEHAEEHVTELVITKEPGSARAWLGTNVGQAGLDVTGHLAPVDARADSLTIVIGSAGLHVDTSTMTPDDEAALGQWLADPDQAKIIQDAKPARHALVAQGWDLNGVIADTALAAYLLKPDQRTYDVADLAIRYLNRSIVDSEDNGQLSFDDGLDVEEAGRRAEAVRDLWGVLESELEHHGGSELLTGLEQPLSLVLGTMEQTGIGIDTELLDELNAEFSAVMARSAEAAYAAIGRQVNLGSPKQLQEVLFEQLAMEKTKRTKTGWTTDAEALNHLWAKTKHPFLDALLQHRDATKLRQTIEGLLKSVQPDGRIHTTFKQTIAATGRLSSADPNLQNIPVRTESGRRIRAAFCVSEGYEDLLTADYSQIEMRIMADLSEDADLIAAFKSGHDFHTAMAARVFDIDPDHVDPQSRARIKAMNYGLAYGLSAYGLSQQLGVTTAEAQALMDDYFESFGGVRDYLHGVVEEARQTGFTQTIMGRRRYLPDLRSDNRQRREMAERMALNAPIQGSAADIIKVAMLRVDEALRAGGFGSRVLLQVHDELLLELARGEREAVEALVREQMASAGDLAVPLSVSVGVGRTWHDAAH